MSDPESTGVVDTAHTFNAQLPAAVLHRFTTLADALVGECRLELGPSELRVRAMDPATVAAVELTLSAEAFGRYETGGGVIGVDLERLGAVLDMADSTQAVHLRLDGTARRLEVTFGDLEYTLGLVDPTSIRSPPESVTPPASDLGEVVTRAEILTRGITAANSLSNHATLAIHPDPDVFIIEADGDTDRFRLERSGTDLRSLTAKEVRSIFSVDYLREIAARFPSETEVTVQFGTDQPLVLEFGYADGTGTARYMIAPRIQHR